MPTPDPRLSPKLSPKLDSKLASKLDYRVVHEVPGRLRLRVPALRDPEMDAAYLES